MRQNAVSSAPQNDDPIQMLATSATMPKRVRGVAHAVERALERVVGGAREQLLQVLEDALLEVAATRARARR